MTPLHVQLHVSCGSQPGFLSLLAPRVQDETRALRVFCALLALGATARLLAVLETDWPSTGQTILMGVAYAHALLLPAWQARARRA